METKANTTSVFSCEDAAQQVLMSSVRLSVCPSAKLKFYLLTALRMFQNVPECMQKVPECMQKVPECMQSVPECYRGFQNKCRKFQNACGMFQNAYRMFQNIPEYMQYACRMFQNVTECVQIHELACSYISLMQLHKLDAAT